MKYLQALLLSIIVQTVFAQNPLPSFNESAAWSFNYGFCQVNCAPNTQQFLYLDGDTVHDGKDYKIVRQYSIETPELFDVDGTYQDCVDAGECDPFDYSKKYYRPAATILLRESNDSIYKVGDVGYTPGSSFKEKEELFYVNNLSKGDRMTTRIHPAPGVLVDSVNYKFIGGLSRKITYLDGGHQIIDGIGMFTPGGMTGYSAFVYEEINVSGVGLGPLDCFGESAIDSLTKSENGNTFRTYSTCVRGYDIVMGKSEGIPQFDFNVFASKNGSLQLSTSIQNLRVFGALGNLVYQSNTEQNNYSSVFTNEGIYILQIEKNNQIYYHKLFFKK